MSGGRGVGNGMCGGYGEVSGGDVSVIERFICVRYGVLS